MRLLRTRADSLVIRRRHMSVDKQTSSRPYVDDRTLEAQGLVSRNLLIATRCINSIMPQLRHTSTRQSDSTAVLYIPNSTPLYPCQYPFADIARVAFLVIAWLIV